LIPSGASARSIAAARISRRRHDRREILVAACRQGRRVMLREHQRVPGIDRIDVEHGEAARIVGELEGWHVAGDDLAEYAALRGHRRVSSRRVRRNKNV
jgi:hypothetical protein